MRWFPSVALALKVAPHRARTSPVRLANRRHTAVTVAGIERLAMQENIQQAATHTRTLKIEATGDFFLKKITPKIRLTGQWLERAGFKPGHRVEVQLQQPGLMTLRCVIEQGREAVR